MAVSSEVARVVHTANGTATFFSYAPMDGVTSANLKVYLFNPTTGVLTLQTLGTHYTFGSGGVTFNTAPPSGRRVILLRQVDLLQPDIYKTNAPFPAAVTEKRFDEIVKGLQQLNDIAQNRAIILPLGDAGFSTNVLPAVEDRKGRVLYFNATTGNPEAKQLADTIVAAPAWAITFLSQSTAAAGLNSIGGVAKAGDTMTGLLTLSGAPTATLHAATKGYVDTEVGTRVAKAGDTMTGLLTLSGAPTATLHAATKGYVDTEVGTRVAKAGDTMTGFLTLHSDPTANMHAATKQYVDSIAPGPNYVLKAGDTMTGFLTLHADPTAAMHAATKQYVDSMSASGNYVQKTGDTMTGFLTLHADPTAAMHAVTKQYVDRQYSNIQDVTAVTAVDFTGIPSWANHIVLYIVMMTTTSHALRVRIGDGNGFVSSNYICRSTHTAAAVNTTATTDCFFMMGNDLSYSSIAVCEIIRQHTINRWLFTARGSFLAGNNNGTMRGAGYLNADLNLDRVRLYVAGGTMTGQCHVEWRR